MFHIKPIEMRLIELNYCYEYKAIEEYQYCRYTEAPLPLTLIAKVRLNSRVAAQKCP